MYISPIALQGFIAEACNRYDCEAESFAFRAARYISARLSGISPEGAIKAVSFAVAAQDAGVRS